MSSFANASKYFLLRLTLLIICFAIFVPVVYYIFRYTKNKSASITNGASAINQNGAKQPMSIAGRRSRRSELLIGVFIGIYGNWLIAVVDKLSTNLSLSMLPVAISFGFLVFYFQEIYSSERHFHKWLSRSTILGIIYFLLVALSLFLNGVWYSEFVFVWVGAFLWVALMQAERFSGLE
jgi:hypothetical protein